MQYIYIIYHLYIVNQLYSFRGSPANWNLFSSLLTHSHAISLAHTLRTSVRRYAIRLLVTIHCAVIIIYCCISSRSLGLNIKHPRPYKVHRTNTMTVVVTHVRILEIYYSNLYIIMNYDTIRFVNRNFSNHVRA